ncbi:hypothetical protein [Terriglobus roseus]|uniref:Uncharacterized protein n=1 Tax=Terriglobus roseus TaxID=392734 RepID=A0A1H4JJK5_9BACT|nr:hypothetical protein [Terriglobus roseus]SEB46490.1 hypothetical protein SAMN05443244_0658 [Terriglobus roseus]
MARGTEKEDVDLPEQTEAQKAATADENRITERDRQRKLQGLNLQRERILSERTSSPHRRSALEAALLEIETQISELSWGIHI